MPLGSYRYQGIFTNYKDGITGHVVAGQIDPEPSRAPPTPGGIQPPVTTEHHPLVAFPGSSLVRFEEATMQLGRHAFTGIRTSILLIATSGMVTAWLIVLNSES
jgi:hypothetical protein